MPLHRPRLRPKPKRAYNAKKSQDLVKVTSIGPELATALVSEVFYRSFDNRKQLAGYVGLTPSHFQSGPMCRD